MTKRRKLLVWIVKLLLALVVACLGVLIYAQSSHALRHVWLPMAAARIGGNLSVEDGSLSIMGKLKLKGVEFDFPNGGGKLNVGSLFVHVVPSSLLRRSAPVIESVEIDSLALVARTVGSGRPKPEKNKTYVQIAKEKGAKKKKSLAGPVAILPISVRHFRARNVSAHWFEGDEERGGVDRADIDVENLSSGQSAQAKINADFIIAPQEKDRTRSGTLALDLNLEPSLDSTSLSCKGTTFAAVQEGPPKAGGGVTLGLRVDSDLEGSFDSRGSVKGSISTTASTSERKTGSLSASVEWDRDGNKLKSKLELKEIERDLMNPILAAFGPAQFDTARLDGSLSVEGDDQGYRFASTLEGKQLSLRGSPDQSPTPPLDIHSAHGGIWNPERNELILSKAGARLERGNQTLGEITLDKSLALYRGENAGSGALQNQPSEVAHLNFTVHDLAVDDLRPWFALADRHALDDVEGGRVEGTLAFTVDASGRRADLRGGMTLAQFSVRSKEGDPSIGPFTVRNQIVGSLENLTRGNLESAATAFSMDGKDLAESRFSGGFDAEKGSVRMRGDVAIPDAGDFLRRLGVMIADQNLTLDGGALKEQVDFSRDQKGEKFTLKETSELQKIKLIAEKTKAIERTISSQCEIDLDPDLTFATIKSAEIALSEPNGTAVGNFAVAGVWPLKTSQTSNEPSREARLNLKVRGLTGGSVVDLLDWPEAQPFGDAPMDADYELIVDPKEGRYVSNGEMRVGPVRFAKGDPDSEEIRLSLKSQIEKKGEEIRNFQFDLISQREEIPPDKIQIKGSGKWGERPRLETVIRVESLSPELYGKQFSPPAEPQSAEKETAPKTQDQEKNKNAEPTPVKPWPWDLNADIQIARLDWRQTQVEEVQVKVVSESENLRAVIERMKLDGGSLQGEMDFGRSGTSPTRSWRLVGEGIDAGRLIASLEPHLAGKFAGKADFKTEAKGTGEGDAFRKSLRGTLEFDWSEGKFSNSELLDLIAQTAGTDIFNQLAFTGFHGEATFDDGWARLKDVVMSGVATRLNAEGRIGLGGELDMTVQPGIGPELKGKIGNKNPAVQFADELFRPFADFLYLPFEVVGKGTIADPVYSVRPKLSPETEKLGKAVKKELDKILDQKDDVGRSLRDDLGDALDGLLGKKKSKKKEKN